MSLCVETTNKRNRDDYGQTTATRFGKRVYLTHVLAWIDANGRLPEGQICHTCDNPPCVNPDHLYDGSHAQNMQDMVDRGRACNAYGTATHCPNGHEYTEENVYWYKPPSRKNKTRICKTCVLARNRATRERKREVA